MPYWERLTILGVVVLLSLLLARFVDRRIQRHELTAGATTRYRILRRTLVAAIVTIAVLSGLLLIPQVRTVAGTLLASGAILGIVIGFAAQRTLSNVVAGILIAFTQPLRLGDWIVVDGTEGVVEEIRLTYTFVRSDDDTRLVIPNDKLVSDTIRNSTIVDRAQRAEITVQVPLGADLGNVIDLLRTAGEGERELEVFVSGIEDSATITLRALAADPADAERLEHALRLRAHGQLRAAGIYA
jgi:small-conductance mechanosensitive channel